MDRELRCSVCDLFLGCLPSDDRPPFTEGNKPAWFKSSDNPNTDFVFQNGCLECDGKNPEVGGKDGSI